MSADAFHITVDCYAGFRAEETPRRFSIGDRNIEVREIIDRWLAPDHRYFKVRGDDEFLYILRHDVRDDQWELIMFDSGKLDETKLSST